MGSDQTLGSVLDCCGEPQMVYSMNEIQQSRDTIIPVGYKIGFAAWLAHVSTCPLCDIDLVHLLICDALESLWNRFRIVAMSLECGATLSWRHDICPEIIKIPNELQLFLFFLFGVGVCLLGSEY